MRSESQAADVAGCVHVKIYIVLKKKEIHWFRPIDDHLDLAGDAFQFDLFRLDTDLVFVRELHYILQHRLVTEEIRPGATDFGFDVGFKTAGGVIQRHEFDARKDSDTKDSEGEKAAKGAFPFRISPGVAKLVFLHRSETPPDLLIGAFKGRH
jgi:hypothetical protein